MGKTYKDQRNRDKSMGDYDEFTKREKKKRKQERQRKEPEHQQ